MSDNPSTPDLLGPLMDEFVERFRRGEKPSLTEFVRRQPDLEEDIRELFPALVMMEHADADLGHSGGAPPHRMTADGRELTQLGDYRILREIGRGGMGVVYEAMQESLGRHVALKVLPWNALLNPTHLKRFQREACVAAALHHSNIVPVFGVGEFEGVHFYAMQFICGQSLDNVLVELRLLRQKMGSSKSTLHGDTSSIVLNGLADPSGSSSGQHYFRRVAEIGSEAAAAMAYAHEHGVLHRDIKPSNLMLDVDGTVWITDFGLARSTLTSSSAMDVSLGADDVSHSGDLIGTVRYMAPERFRGKADARSDLYSLGLTLYEMLTLRSAFEAADRVELIRLVTHETPISPRRIDHQIPRDLETIVLKAIARDPEARYRTCAELAEDLQRFLADRPIVARRTPITGRLVLWCRRNPVVASLLGLVATLLILLTVGSNIAAFRLSEENAIAVKNLERARLAEVFERDARRLADQRLFDALLAQARAGRRSTRAGRRNESLSAVRHAAALLPSLNPDPAIVRELRNEAIGCMSLIDLQVDVQWPDDTPAGSTSRFTEFDHQVKRFARVDSRGEIVVRRLEDHSELFRLEGEWNEARSTPYVQFSPNDEFLAACGESLDGTLRFKMWRLDDRSLVLDAVMEAWTASRAFAFSPDSRQIAVQHSLTHITIFDTLTGQSQPKIALAIGDCVVFNSNGKQLATNSGSLGSDVAIIELSTGRTEHLLSHPMNVSHFAFSSDGWLMAAACNDKNVYVWDLRHLDQPTAICRGHLSQAIQVAFSLDSQLLMSASFDGTTRLWDPRRGESLVVLDHRCTSFSNDNRWLSFSDPTLGLGRCQLSDTRECRVLTASLPADSVVDVEFSPDGTLLTAASRRSGVDLWSVPSGSEVARVSVGVEVRSIEFTPDGKQLLTSGNPSVDRWPIDAMTQDNAKDRFAQREILAESNFPCETALSADGQRLVASLAGDVINVYDLRGPFAPVRMKSVPSFSWFVAISPNGRWVAASEKRNGDIPVWDAATGELLVHLRTTDTLGALVAFSPDNRWLIVSELGRFVFYETANWREGRRWTPPGNPCFGRIEFDSEMKICATLGQRSVTLCDAATFREIATLATSRQEQLATGYPEGTGGLNFSPDGSLLAVGTMHGTVQLWNLRLVRQRLGDLNLGWPEPQADAR